MHERVITFANYRRQRACTSKVAYARKADVPVNLKAYQCPFCDQWHGASRNRQKATKRSCT
jgi:hypothetical protein